MNTQIITKIHIICLNWQIFRKKLLMKVEWGTFVNNATDTCDRDTTAWWAIGISVSSLTVLYDHSQFSFWNWDQRTNTNPEKVY